MWRLIFFVWSAASLGVSSDYQSCFKPIAKQAPWRKICMHSQKKLIHDLPPRVSDWGSQGRAGKPWYFADENCNNYFSDLFLSIIHATPAIRLSSHDLFHAHILSYGNNNSEQALVFHAKEYPTNLEPIKNNYQPIEQRFSSFDESYQNRNFVIFSQATEIADENILYLVLNTGRCREFFDPALANTLSERRIAERLSQGKIVGDVNLFEPQSLNQIKYRFYSNELDFTGKSMSERQAINKSIDRFLNNLSQSNLLYFMTGLEL